MALSVKVLNPPTVWSVPEVFKKIYSHAVQVSDASKTLYISGQFGIGPDGRLPAEFAEQANLAMDNVEALLAASGMTRGNVVKLTYFLTRLSDAPGLGAIRRERGKQRAARSDRHCRLGLGASRISDRNRGGSCNVVTYETNAERWSLISTSPTARCRR